MTIRAHVATVRLVALTPEGSTFVVVVKDAVERMQVMDFRASRFAIAVVVGASRPGKKIWVRSRPDLAAATD